MSDTSANQTNVLTPSDGTPGRFGAPIWIGLGAVFLIGIAVALWLASQSGRLETRAEIRRLIEFEEEFSLAGDVAVVLALQDQTNDAWLQARALQVHAEMPAPAPVPVATVVPQSLAITEIVASEESIVRAEVRREFQRPGGNVAAGAATLNGDDTTATFALFQFYELDEEVGWIRIAPPDSFWGQLLLWSGERLQVVHYGVDESLVTTIMAEVDSLAAQACDLWQTLRQGSGQACSVSEPVAIYLTNSPVVFLDDPTANTHVVLDAEGARPGEKTYLHIPSPHLAGSPIDAAGRAWLVEAYSVRVIAELAERTAGPGPAAAELHRQALAELELAAADPGLRFEVPATAAADASPATPPPTATHTPIPTPVLETYVVQPGDTLIRIAERFNTTVEIILAFNNIPNADNLQAGQELIIPPPDATPPTRTPSPTPTPSATSIPSPTPIPAGTIVEYVVQEGDTLVGIAAFYETTVDVIVAENNLANQDAIFVGQRLRVPVGLAREGA